MKRPEERLDHRKLLSRGSISRRYAVLAGANLLASAVGFLVVVLIVDRFGPEGLGEMTLALSVVGYALIAASCGTQLHAVRLVAAEPDAVASVAGNVLLLRLVLGAGTYCALLTLATLVSRLAEIRLLIALFGLSIFVNAINVSWVPQALQRTSLLAAANLGTQLLFLVGLWGLLSNSSSLATVALSKVGADLAVAAALLVWVLRRAGPIQFPRSLRTVWQTVMEAAPIAGTKLIRALALGSDLLIVGLILGHRELGHYAAAGKFFMFFMSLAAAYLVILLPRVAERAGQPGSAMADEIASSLRRILPPAAAMVVLVAVFARPLLVLLFDPSFAAAALALRLLGIAFLANLIGRHFRQVLLARGRQATDLRLTVLAAAVHVTLKVALVAILGLSGAALGTLVGEATLMWGLWRAARPELAPRKRSSLSASERTLTNP